MTPDIEFRQIRVHGSPASRASGYEELSSLLIMDGFPGKVEWPAGTTFDRFGNPDGGREGRGVLPNGDVWAWQSKYLFEFTDTEAAQVEKSVKRALETEPNLKKYIVALPYDLPAGDTTRQGKPVVSAFTRWTKKTAEWEALATAKGMSVEFVFIGQSDLTDALTSKVENAGRVRYWFGASVLSAKEQQDRLADVVAAAGRRYTPKLHVEVEVSKVFDGLGRAPGWVHEIQVVLGALRRARARGWRAPADDVELQGLLDEVVRSLALAEIAIEELLDEARSTRPLPEPSGAVGAADAALDAALVSVRRHADERGLYVGEAATTLVDIRSGLEAVGAVVDLLGGPAAAAAQRGFLLMTGRAGVGKTHLFCDVAARRIDAGQPTIVILGQDFDSTTLMPQIGRLAQIEGTLDEVLQVLDAAGEASGCMAMVLIDALNEGADPARWVDGLARLAAAVDRFPRVVLAVSCRTEFVDPVVGTLDPSVPRIEHLGFAEATPEAVDRYTKEYGLERLGFPVLNPEFGNALFLKLACEALSTLGEKSFALGATGLTTVVNAFLDAVNVRLSEAGRCDYDQKDGLVQKVVRQVATLGAGPYSRAEVKAFADAALPRSKWSQNLYGGLLREGVFMETRDDGVYFAYQRLGDVQRALLIAELAQADVRSWFAALKPQDMWVEAGVVGALAVIAPERFGVELPDLLADEHHTVPHEVKDAVAETAAERFDVELPDSLADDRHMVLREVVDAFLESLALRSPEHTTDRTSELAEKLIGQSAWQDRMWATALQVACIPGHALNADWTHRLLLARPLAERDASWSEWLTAPFAREQDDPVEVLLNWAWPERDDAADVPDEIARLAALILGWMLTTPDRQVRDRATKALVAVGERSPAGFAQAVRQFRTCDDPYVIERLAAAVCAIALRADDATTVLLVADAAAELIADGMPIHLAARDYLRRTAKVAKDNGWEGPTWQPPYGTEWPVEMLTREAIEELAGPPDYRYSSIWSSLTGMLGDFGRYVLQPATEQFAVADQAALQAVGARFIFSRAVDFGWTPERFADLEQRRRYLRGNSGPAHIERYGKKYQWIGLHELLARLTDNHQLKDRWEDEKPPFNYHYLEQLLSRDIDPTVMVRPVADDGRPRWYAPVSADFPDEISAQYPSDTDGVPDPIDLIAHTDDEGSGWLALTRHSSWSQELAPEIEALKAPNLYIWIQIRSYLVPVADIAAVKDWATDRDYDGRWMPEEGEVGGHLLGTYPDLPGWEEAGGDVAPAYHGQERPPTSSLRMPFSHYAGSGAGRDTTGNVTGYVPSRAFSDLLHLNRGRDFVWTDASGSAVMEPAAGMDDESVFLVRRDLADSLAASGLTLMWTVLLNKERRDHDHGGVNEDLAYVSASATYVLENGQVVLVSSTATHRMAGDSTGTPVPWSLMPEA